MTGTPQDFTSHATDQFQVERIHAEQKFMDVSSPNLLPIPRRSKMHGSRGTTEVFRQILKTEGWKCGAEEVFGNHHAFVEHLHQPGNTHLWNHCHCTIEILLIGGAHECARIG